MSNKVYLAIDLGASSGRVMAAIFDGTKIDLQEIHRFPNSAQNQGDEYHWDIQNIFSNIKLGLKEAAQKFGSQIVSTGVDSWGVDYGLLDAEGNLMGQPFAYRDPRTNGMQEEVDKRLGLQEIYETTGIQFMFFNTLLQLMSEVVTERDELKQASRLLFTPDLINYWLSGTMANEYTIASTSQLLDVRQRDWAKTMLEKLGIPTSMLGPITMPCSKLGPVLPEVAAETGLSASTSIVAVGGHDTASAIAAVPAIGNSHAYLSSGTWSLMGVESDQPVVTDRSFEYGFTNEGGLGGKIRLLKNITGLWLVQECRRIWNEDGAKLSFTDLGKLAKDVEPFTAFINPDDPTFAEPGDMPKRICEYCERTGQPVPQTRGTIIRVALESLAFRYRTVFNMLEDLIGKRIDTLHIVGGGIQEKTLNQLTANAINRNVIAGPIEATALGNVMAQMMADGTVDTLEAGREIIRASCETELYEAQNVADFDAAYQRYKDITKA